MNTETISQPTSAVSGEVAKAVVEEGKQEAPKEDSVSPKLGMIARKERALVQKQQEFTRQQQEWEKQKSEFMARLDAVEQKEKLWEQDPLKAIEARGLDYQKLTERVLAGEDLTPKELQKMMDERFKAQEEKLQQEKDAIRKAQEEATMAEHEEVINNFKGELKSFVTTKADNYKLTNLFDAEADLVFELIEATYEEHGKLLSNDEAADLAEKYFIQQYEKAKAIMEKIEATEEEKELGVAPTKKPTQTTLTNSMNQASPGFLPAKSEEDRMRRAMAALDKNK